MCHPSWALARIAAQRLSDPARPRHGDLGVTEGMPSCAAEQVTGPVRSREAPVAEMAEAAS